MIKLPTFFLNPKLHMDDFRLQKALEEVTGIQRQQKEQKQQLKLTPQPQVKEPSLESSFGFSEEEQNIDYTENEQKSYFERKFYYLKGITKINKSESISSDKSKDKSNGSQPEISPSKTPQIRQTPLIMKEMRRVFGRDLQQFRFWNKVKSEVYNLEDLRPPQHA